jgi:hypothetical protein
VKNRLKIINITLGHVQTLEQALDSSEEILANLTPQAAQLITQEESNEHLIMFNAITADLNDDIKDIIE